jgi:hypothetical protein
MAQMGGQGMGPVMVLSKLSLTLALPHLSCLKMYAGVLRCLAFFLVPSRSRSHSHKIQTKDRQGSQSLVE